MKEADVNTRFMMVEDEQMNERQGSPLERHSTVIMTGEEPLRGSTPDREIERGESGLSELASSPLGSFQSLPSTQGSKKDKMITYVPPLREIKVLQFEDTLSEDDRRNLNLIYESLLMEGKAGNLTDLTLGMVLPEKPLAWLQVMHGRLKRITISSETFKEKKKAEYDA